MFFMHSMAFGKLSSSLSRGALVLTVNARLTRFLVSEYGLAMMRSGKTAWATPQVMPFFSWVSSLWEEHGNLPALTGLRARVLWEKIVERDPQASSNGPSSGIARSSYDALRLMREYGIELPIDDFYLTGEAKALRKWQAAYESELRRLGYIGEAVVPAEVKRLIDKGLSVDNNEVILAGFDELSPMVFAIADALRKKGVSVSLWPEPEDLPHAGEAAILPCEDEEEEVIRAARWARALYQPGKKIGFIVPDLEHYRSLIIREFTAELAPASVLPEGAVDPVFNISLGAPLIDEPLVRSAIDIVSIGEGKEKSSVLMKALTSPFVAGGEARSFSALDFKLRENNRPEASLAEIRSLLSGNASARINAWMGFLREQRKKQPPGNWAKAFTELLDRAGWLRDIKLSSGEYQAFAAWNKALEDLASLDDVLGSISRKEAASHLASIVSETIHQVETPDADIQVLGILEATGFWFDHMRVLGCHEYALPLEPTPNPFIPFCLQRAKGLPHSTSEKELEFAKTVAKRLLSSAPSVQVSWPLVSQDRELSVSPLFRSYPAMKEESLPSARLLDMPLGQFEESAIDGPVPVTDEEKATLKGGTSILKNQSICPFRAFAIHRLGAIPLPTTELDLKPEARGDIVHNAMRLFWDDVKDSRRLQELKDSGGLKTYIESIASKAMEAAKVPPPLSKRFMELEFKRLTELLMDWAEVELQRETGFKVKTIELEKELIIGGLTMKGRVDRIDELETGGEVIFDYKTGSPELKDWLTKRPMDPQLLIYSIGSRFDALSFARIRPGECKFVGICREEILPGIRPYDDNRFKEKVGGLEWDALMGFWKEVMEGLAKDFLDGINDVDPNGWPKDTKACDRCELILLCRFQCLVRDGNGDEGTD